MDYVKTRSFTQAMMVLPFLEGLDALYPGFQSWCINQVVLGKDVLMLARDGGKVAAIALGKRSAHETKLRSRRAEPSTVGRGCSAH